MKVGTDGVLLGAWVNLNGVKEILDVGTGTGLVAIMLAQRCPANIIGIELDKIASEQAKENVLLTEWKERIEIINENFNKWQTNAKFDLIVSNPPYFVNSLKSPDENRSNARHTDNLSYEELIKKVNSLLTDEGVSSIIIPTTEEKNLKDIAKHYNLYATRQTYVFTKPGSISKRTLISFCKTKREYKTDELIIELSRHHYSKEFKDLTKDYYLK